MSKFVILLIVSIAVICSAAVPKKSELPSGKQCAIGSSWKSQCNDCNCSNEGLPLCTRAECTGNEPDPIRHCAPGTRWEDDCNTCWCEDGVAMCTLMGCYSDIKPPAQCLQPFVMGDCRASIFSYGYNTKTRKCERFLYGGCGGNSNRFETEQECKKTCITFWLN